MRQMIQDVHHFTDFRLLLNEDYLARAKENPSYSLRAYARDIEVSISHLSNVLGRKKFFSFETAQSILKKLQLWDQDEEYASQLIRVECEESLEEKKLARSYLKRHSIGHGFIPKPEKDAVLKSLGHFLFYGLVIKFDSFSRILDVFNIMGWSEETIRKIALDLMQANYIVWENDKIDVTDREFFIETHKELYKLHVKFTNYICEQILKTKELDLPISDGKGALFSLDHETVLELKKHTDHYVRGAYRIANKTKNPTHLVLFSASVAGWEIC
ncbi:MAG: hypothetical protein KDD61_07985 [Bdellovibrionales bacterium]|nr:hypothetical protein [Bdellovibrionales bacterium]